MVPRKLPSELEEEILIRVPHECLVRFRCVCKEWNTLFKDKRFMSKHFACARPEFMFQAGGRIYSISVSDLNEDPSIKVRDITSYDIPGSEFIICDGQLFLFEIYKEEAALWNPWLRQTRLIPAIGRKPYRVFGLGYDSSSSRPEKSLKIFGQGLFRNHLQEKYLRFVMFEFETNEWKFIDHTHILGRDSLYFNNVYLNGNLYWTAFIPETGQYIIQILDALKEIVKPFCILPFKHEDMVSGYRAWPAPSRFTREIGFRC